MRNKTQDAISFGIGAALLLLATGLHAAPLPPAPELVSPGERNATVQVATACPTFSWTPVPGAAAMELVVYALPEGPQARELPADPVLTQDLPGAATSWTPSTAECLIAGETYAWTVGALTESEASVWSDIRVFQVSKLAGRSEIEQALERVLARFVEQKRIDEATAAAIREDPRPMLETLPVSEETAALASVPNLATTTAIRGTTGDTADNSIAILGEATDAAQTHLTWGVVGKAKSGAEDSAGVLGISESTFNSPKYGVLGISSDQDPESAGVKGEGTQGVIGIGSGEIGMTKIGVGVIGISNSGTNPTAADIGVFGSGKTGVKGTSSESDGRAGDFQNSSGTALFAAGGSSDTSADLQLQTGRIKISEAQGDTIELLVDAPVGPLLPAKFVADGSLLQNVVAIRALTLGADPGVPESGFLRTNLDRTVVDGTAITFETGAKLFFGGDPGGSTLNLPSTGITGAGAGSGLNADLLDNKSSAAFLTNPPGVALNMGNLPIVNIGNADTDFDATGALTIGNDSPATTLMNGSISTLGGLSVTKNIRVGAQIDLQSSASLQNPSASLIRLQDNPSLSQRRLDVQLNGMAPNTVRLIAEDDSAAVHSGASFVLQAENGLGAGTSGGDVTLVPGQGNPPGVEGSVNITGTKLVLDSDATPVSGDSDIEIVATQGLNTALNGALRYRAAAPKRWEISTNNGGSWSPIITDQSTVFVALANDELFDNDTNHVFHFEDNETNFTLDLDLETGVDLQADGNNPDGASVALMAGAAAGSGIGGDLTLAAGQGAGNALTSSRGGNFAISAGPGPPGGVGPGGAVTISAGNGAGGSQSGGGVTLTAGNSGSGAGAIAGDIVLDPGNSAGGTPGKVLVEGELKMGTTPQPITGASSVTALTFTSTVATGTTPLTVASTDKVDNLNADQVDGMDASDFAAAVTGGYLPLSGGTMTGPLAMATHQLTSTVPVTTAPFVVASTKLVDNLNADQVDGMDATAFAGSGHSHSTFLPLDGSDDMTGNITGAPASNIFSLIGEDGDPAVSVRLKAGDNNSTGNGADVTVEAGNATAGNAAGGDITLMPGAGHGAGLPGKVIVAAGRLFQVSVFSSSPTCSPTTLGAVYLKNNAHSTSLIDSLCVCLDSTADTMDNPTFTDIAGGSGC